MDEPGLKRLDGKAYKETLSEIGESPGCERLKEHGNKV